jgi:hypothetical protein
MKPIPHFNSAPRHSRDDSRALCDRRSFPLTDHSFQSTDETVARASAISEKGVSELRTFRKISNEFFGTEMNRDSVAEFVFFALITVIAAWPITLMIHQLIGIMI